MRRLKWERVWDGFSIWSLGAPKALARSWIYGMVLATVARPRMRKVGAVMRIGVSRCMKKRSHCRAG